MRLLKLEPSVREMLSDGRLSAGHAKVLLSLEDAELQKQAAEQVVLRRLSVRETEKLVKKLQHPAEPEKAKEEPVNEQLLLAYKEIEARLERKTGTRVQIKAKGEKGTITIDYYSQEDLERLIDLIG